MTNNNKFGCLPIDKYQSMMKETLNRVCNASAFSDPLSYGYDQVITTTTQIIAGVLRQRFYTLNDQALSDFVPIEVGTGAYSTRLFQYASAIVGDDFKTGIIAPTTAIHRDANVDIKISNINIFNNYWRMKYVISKEQLEQARVNAETFSLIEEKEIARKTTWDLGIQESTFLGLDDNQSYGLLNQPDATVNTTLLPNDLSSLTDDEYGEFLSTLAGIYNTATNGTVMFNRLVMPSSDFYALGRPYGQYGLTRLQVLENTLSGYVAGGFRVLHTIYNETAGTNGGKRYMLYRYDPGSIIMYVPKPYTPYPLTPPNLLDLISESEGQFTTPYLKRPQEMLYLDVLPSGTRSLIMEA